MSWLQRWLSCRPPPCMNVRKWYVRGGRTFETSGLRDPLGEKNLSPHRMPRMTASQSGKPSLQRRLRSWYVRPVLDLKVLEMSGRSINRTDDS